MYLTLANIQLTNGNKSLHVAQPNMCLKGFNSHFEKRMKAQINKMPLTDFLRDQQLDSDLNCTTVSSLLFLLLSWQHGFHVPKAIKVLEKFRHFPVVCVLAL